MHRKSTLVSSLQSPVFRFSTFTFVLMIAIMGCHRADAAPSSTRTVGSEDRGGDGNPAQAHPEKPHLRLAQAQAQRGGGDCNAKTWHKGAQYRTNDVVRFTNGQYYVATHDNPGYDPTISTWFWSPTTCSGGGGGNGGGGCNTKTWQKGAQYRTNDVVRFTNGQYYVATHDNPGYDPTISTWFWSAKTCGGSGGGGGGGGGGTRDAGGGAGLAALLSESTFNSMFPGRNPAYTYQGLVQAASSYPAFATSGDTTVRKREVAAFLANVAHETGNLVYIEEINKSDYCSPSPECPCAPGHRYFGRGPLQLSWNYNYCAAGKALHLPLQSQPELVATDAKVAWQTGLWFWMTSTGAGSQTGHDASVSGRFGETIRTINGALECNGKKPETVQSRVQHYQHFCQLLGVDPGNNLGC
ncbi:MAG TPA: chitinase [Kofleriaceae bacterium]